MQSLRSLHFVLYGGTAIALRLGHRISVDFDFFSSSPLDRERIRQALPFLQQSTLLQEEANAQTFLVPVTQTADHPNDRATVKLSLFGGLEFGRVGNPQLTSDEVALVAAPEDLLATKLKVILQRAEAKDYIDIAALLQDDRASPEAVGDRLARGLSAAAALFGSAFQPAEALKALVFFEDGDLPDLSLCTRLPLERAASEVGPLPPAPMVTPQLH
ncbi:nucleotidyl transferase AbiEii/AbiGii toxin family protein [Synechococcus sp. GFB01]|uniref:nucleotidyl transferase AbiEii/AbiGii toxin family protein n=1 Tax=Synechococcus sp. GFB01 TaxID=1662190 RepID=UPI0013792047|nr:nucleotidyl transferase AbiEii/AbiGii toxin family protein [Synechococcus sp. GFB01]